MEFSRKSYAEPPPIFYKYSERRGQRQKGKWNFRERTMPKRLLYPINITKVEGRCLFFCRSVILSGDVKKIFFVLVLS